MVKRTVWLSKLPEFARELRTTERMIFREVTELAAESIIHGSTLTGSPGQPTDLKDEDPTTGKEWQTIYENENTALIGNADPSARSVEDGISYRHGGRPLTKLKSGGGGFHSLALTYQNADKIIAEVVRRVKR